MEPLSPPRKKSKGSPESMDSKLADRFSRQNAALGAETTAKLIKMRVVLYGLRGVGIETAKNLLLQGIGVLTLVDPRPCVIQDMGCNFFVNEEDVKSGSPRAITMAPRLRELNPVAEVSVEGALTDELVKNASALVICDTHVPLSELIRLNDLCRANGVSFFYNFCGGVTTSIFVDHGDNHIIHDKDGTKPMEKIITDISMLEVGEILIRYSHPDGALAVAMEEGHLEISEVEGLPGLNGAILATNHPWKDPALSIRASIDISGLGKYEKGGIITEKKMPFNYPMQSFKEKLANPGELVMTDMLNFGSEYQQHAALIGVLTFQANHGRKPTIGSSEDAVAVIGIIGDLMKSGEVTLPGDLDEAYITKYILNCNAELQAMSAFTGGVLAQEVVKCTGKCTPIPGWLHFGAVEALPPTAPTAADREWRGSRTDELASVYGWEFVNNLGDLNYFMVGCGALGCEFMKNFALNGICCGPKGKLTVTDADRIELSNLSRQFLFREHNVGQPKSRAAGAMATTMNSGFSVVALEEYVGPASETTFNDTFWLGLDGVCNALDNIESRRYIDEMCVRYDKSLLESGTTGTSGNVDTICPGKTQTYRDGGDAAEGQGVPMCTLRNFPHLTDHCIEWARDQFAAMFVKIPKAVEKFASNPAFYGDDKRSLLSADASGILFEMRCVRTLLRAAKSPSLDSAIQAAYDIFYFYFNFQIRDLIEKIPKETKNKDGTPFWGEKKRFPTAQNFDPKDESHLDFLASTAMLFAVAIGAVPPKKDGDSSWLAEYRDLSWIAAKVPALVEPTYVAVPATVELPEGEATEESAAVAPAADVDALKQSIFDDVYNDCVTLLAGDTIKPLETQDFEKDDDLNYHIAFITGCCNLRCDNYTIKRSDFQKVKIIAGKIIAAIATTTAAVCGLVILELFKLQLKLGTDSYMNRQIGLAVNAFTSFTAEEPKKRKTETKKIKPDETTLGAEAFNEKGEVKEEYFTSERLVAYPEGHSTWDKLVVSGDLTLDGFKDWLANDHGLTLQGWTFHLGTKKETDKDGKPFQAPKTANIYPPPVVLDPSLLPGLDLSKQQAMMALMKTPAAKPTQAYLQLWQKSKDLGQIPPMEETISKDSTLKSILMQMQKKCDSKVASGEMDTPILSDMENRKFWVITPEFCPAVVETSTQDDVTLAALKITF